MEQALLVVQAIDNCAVTQLHNHSALQKGVHIRELRARFLMCAGGTFPTGLQLDCTGDVQL